MLDKKELIKQFLLEGEDKEEKFEIAWDIKNYLDKILEEITYKQVFRSLKKEVKKVLPSQFVISRVSPWGLYVTKEKWKEKADDRGIVAVAVERQRYNATAGLVKNKEFKVKSEDTLRDKLFKESFITTHRWWLGYLSNVPESFSLSLLDYYKTILVSPERLIDDYLQAIKQILKILENREVVELLEKFVEERKKQLEVENG